MSRVATLWISGLLWVAVAILANLAAQDRFVRIDLTRNRAHSLAPTSIDAVIDLREPLTVRAFFSPNLPAPYNNVERRVRDLLEELDLHAGANFNYRFYAMGGDDGEPDQTQEFEELARSYLIVPVQIQEVERDEVNVRNAYMGLAFLHGDRLETIPALTTTELLEFRVVEAITSLTQRVSRVLALPEDIGVDLYFSGALGGIDPRIAAVADTVAAAVARLDEEAYDRLEFRRIDTDRDEAARDRAASLGLSAVRVSPDAAAPPGYAGVMMSVGEQAVAMDLVVPSAAGLTFKTGEEIDQSLEGMFTSLLGSNDRIGYLADFDTPPYRGRTSTTPEVIEPNMATFYSLVTRFFQFDGVLLADESIPTDVNTLLVVAPQAQFSEAGLFRLDQFLLRGGSVAVFTDPYDIYPPIFGGGLTYIPRQTGLEMFLEHHGVRIDEALVFDERSYVLREPNQAGGVSQIPVYNAPLIPEQQIATDLPFLQGLGEIILVNVAPLSLTLDGSRDVEARGLLRTSDRSWTLSDELGFVDPLAGPPPGVRFQSHTLAYLLEGEFRSYFADRPIPDLEEATDDLAVAGGEPGQTDDLPASIAGETGLLEGGRGRLLVFGTSAIVGDNLLQQDGTDPNARLVLNLIDYLNGRVDRAVTRNKGRGYVPLEASTPRERTAVKTFAIGVLPALVAAVGISVLVIQLRRRRSIRRRFGEVLESDGKGGDTRRPKGRGAKRPGTRR